MIDHDTLNIVDEVTKQQLDSELGIENSTEGIRLSKQHLLESIENLLIVAKEQENDRLLRENEDLKARVEMLEHRNEKLETFRERNSIQGKTIGRATFEIEAQDKIGNSSWGLTNSSETRRVTYSELLKIKVDGTAFVVRANSFKPGALPEIFIDGGVSVRSFPNSSWLGLNEDDSMEKISKKLK